MSVLYQIGEDNMVEYSSSRMIMDTVSHVKEGTKHLVKDFHRLPRRVILLQDSPNGDFVVHNNF